MLICPSMHTIKQVVEISGLSRTRVMRLITQLEIPLKAKRISIPIKGVRYGDVKCAPKVSCFKSVACISDDGLEAILQYSAHKVL